MKTRKKNKLTSLFSITFKVLLLILLLTASACEGPFNLSTVLGLEMGILILSPSNTSIASSSTQVFTVTGGTEPYTWSVYSGPGTISGGTTASETYNPEGLTGIATIKVTDSEGYFGSATVTINNIDPLLLLIGTQKLYPVETTQLYATGGYGNYKYTIVTNNSGADLDINTGAYTAGATPGDDLLRVTDDSSATQDVTIKVIDPATNIPNIDYIVNTVNALPDSAQVDTAFTADFTHKNIGEVGGGNVVQWTAFISTTNNMNGIISLVESGTVSALDAVTPSAIPQVINGSWPSIPGTYFIVVHLSADIDINTTNNVGASAFVTVDVPNVDYEVHTQPTGSGSVLIGDAINESFRIKNSGSDDPPIGLDIDWTAWISTDTTLNAGDYQIVSNTTSAIPGIVTDPANSSGDINITGSWPIIPGDYYIIITWSSPEDADSSNNTMVSADATTVNTLNIDYVEHTAPTGSGTVLIGDVITESFRIWNSGPDDGPLALDIDWIVWMSSTDNIFNTGDYQIASGTISAIPGTITDPVNSSGDINIVGNWPEVPDDYYLIITWSSSEDSDTSNNSMASENPTTVENPENKYSINEFTSGPSTVEYANTAVNGTFTVQNSGPDEDPGEGFSWKIYASLNNSISFEDILIDSGTETGLLIGDGAQPFGFWGFWPDNSADYYIIAVIESTYDTDLTDNTLLYSGVPTSVIFETDYEIIDVTYHPLGLPGAELAAGPLSSIVTVFTDHNFTIHEKSNIAGSRLIYYNVYASTDMVLDASDGPSILSGSVNGQTIGAGGYYIIPYDDNNESWPNTLEPYYLIFSINAADDVNNFNDRVVVGPVIVNFALDSEPNNDIGPFGATPTEFTDLTAGLPTAKLELGDIIRIDGSLGGADDYDTFGFTLGTGTTSISINAVWDTSADDINLHIWDENNQHVDFQDITPTIETKMTFIIGLEIDEPWNNGPWYVNVDNHTGANANYTLYIEVGNAQ